MGLRVRVDGFMRTADSSAVIYDPRKTRFEGAGRAAPPRKGPVESFELIKCRHIYEIRADGSEKLIWETKLPFRGL